MEGGRREEEGKSERRKGEWEGGEWEGGKGRKKERVRGGTDQ